MNTDERKPETPDFMHSWVDWVVVAVTIAALIGLVGRPYYEPMSDPHPDEVLDAEGR